MNHIFYLHSNTCVISCFETLEGLVNKGENVVVVLERNTAFPFFEGKVKLFNMQTIIDKYRKNTTNALSRIINYKLKLFPQCALFANEIIDKQDFVLYTPSYNMYTIRPFVNNPYCKGYFFIEEGFQAYLSEEKLQEMYKTRRYKGGRFLLGLIGEEDNYDYEITSKFKGCIGLSKYSFPWCKNKIITGFNGYFENMPYEDTEINYLISTDFLKDDLDIIKEAFKFVVDNILKKGINAKIAIKFHPTAYSFENGKVVAVIEYLKVLYKNTNVIILPPSYSLETLMYHRKIELYCIFGISSLMLYGLMLGTKPFAVKKGYSSVSTMAIVSIPDFLSIANT